MNSPLPPHFLPASQPDGESSNTVSQASLPAGTLSVANTLPIDNARQRLAVKYARSLQRARLLYVLIIAVLSVGLIFAIPSPESFLWWLGWLASMLANMPGASWQPLDGWYPLLVLVYFVLISIAFLVLTVPFGWYTSFVIPRRYGLRKGTTWQWLKDLGQSLFIFFIRLWLLVEVITLLLAIQPQTWWAWTALVQFLFSILTTRFMSLRLFPLFNKIKIEPLSEGELTRRLHELLTRLRIPACSLFHVKVSHRTSAANAFFTGWGNGRRIILTDTLMQNFTLDEIEVILAHELGHLVHHDIWTRLVLRGLILLGFFYLISLYLTNFSGMGGSFPIWPLIMPFLLLLLLWFARLTTRYRRYQEYQADEFALQATRNVQAFKSAMTRLTNLNLVVATSSRRARHPGSHPTLIKRLQHADEFAAKDVRKDTRR